MLYNEYLDIFLKHIKHIKYFTIYIYVCMIINVNDNWNASSFLVLTKFIAIF